MSRPETAHRSREPAYYDPFAGQSDLAWTINRVQEGYFGPLASYDRSEPMEYRFDVSALMRINTMKARYTTLLNDPVARHQQENRKEVTVMVEKEEGGKKSPRQESVDWNKDLELQEFAREWQTIPKGGAEELAWTEKAIALTAAGFEQAQRQAGSAEFSLRDNQVYYMTLLLMNKGKYEFGSLETDRRGVELPTGEGKTVCFGLTAPIMALQGERVLVVEPNYISAQNHAGQMAGFYETFFRQTTGVVTSVAEKEGSVHKRELDEYGIIQEHQVRLGGMKSYRQINGQMIEDAGATGRKKAWEQQIVYVDPDSLAFDYLADHQIGAKTSSGQPELGTVSLMIAEADDLLFDKARNPYIVSEKMTGDEAWQHISELSGLEAFYPEGIAPRDKQAVTAHIMFTIWSGLYQANRNGEFIEGYGQDYMLIGKHFKGSERMSAKANDIVIQLLARQFGYDPAAEEAKIDALMGTWGALDMYDKDGWSDAVERLRDAYRFTSPESEVKLKKIFAEGGSKNLLTTKIKQALRLDHERTVWKAVSQVVNETDVDPDRADKPEFHRKQIRNDIGGMLESWKELDLTDGRDRAQAVDQIREVYRFTSEETIDHLHDLLAGGTLQPDLSGKIANILQADYDAMMAVRYPEMDPEIENNLDFLTLDNRKAIQDLYRWLDQNSDVVDAAIGSLFGMRSQVDFLGGKHPVLLDEYGFPLERHQLQDISQVFLQLHNIWETEKMADPANGPITQRRLLELEKKYAGGIDISRTTSRITFPSLVEQAKRVVVSSGSLIPAATSMVELYGMETLAVARHLDIPMEIPSREDFLLDASARVAMAHNSFGISLPDNVRPRTWKVITSLLEETKEITPEVLEKRLAFLTVDERQTVGQMLAWGHAHADLADVAYESVFGSLAREWHKERLIRTKCLDGGPAAVKFMPSEQGRLVELQRRADEIKRSQKMGLFIVQDIETANELKQLIPEAVLATGEQELAERGTLDRTTAVAAPGKVIITTWIAHRDIDVKMTEAINAQGGLDCVVCGTAPTERGLWQALQRSLRGDMKGTRTLLLTERDYRDIKNRDILTGQTGMIHRPAAKVHAERVAEINKKWQKALSGDGKAMESLFGTYLSSLRLKEESMKRQLMTIMIRDARLAKWQEMFVATGGRFNPEMEEFMDGLEEDVSKRLVARIYGIGLPSRAEAMMRHHRTREMKALLDRIEMNIGMVIPLEPAVREESLRQGWADFLRFLEVDVYAFMTNPDIQKLTPDLQRAKYISHVESILTGHQE